MVIVAQIEMNFESLWNSWQFPRYIHEWQMYCLTMLRYALSMELRICLLYPLLKGKTLHLKRFDFFILNGISIFMGYLMPKPSL